MLCKLLRAVCLMMWRFALACLCQAVHDVYGVVQTTRHVVAAVFMADAGLQGMSDEAITVEQFCRRYVEPMGEESDHVHIVALTDALQVCTQGLSSEISSQRTCLLQQRQAALAIRADMPQRPTLMSHLLAIQFPALKS